MFAVAQCDMVMGIANGSQGPLDDLIVLKRLADLLDRNLLAIGKNIHRHSLDFHLGSVPTNRSQMNDRAVT
jgi:hypothetical protein